HRRQALVGLAASLVLAAAAVPALIHTATSSGHSATTASSTEARPGSTEGSGNQTHPTGRPGRAPGRGSGHAKGKGTGKGNDQGQTGQTSAGPSQTPANGNTMGAEAAPCTTIQLTSSAEVGAPNGDGKVYGTFTVSNTSQASCSVPGPGTVGAV